MRGSDDQTASLLSYVSCEARVPADHPLRVIRAIVDQALSVLSATFDEMYAQAGRPSIASKKLLRVLPFQAFYLIRSERQLMEQLDYNLLFRWFVGLAMDAPVWDPSTFSKNRDGLSEGDVARRLFGGDRRAAARAGPDVGRPLFGRRHSDPGVDESQIVPAKAAGGFR
jgi:transposase